MSDLVDPITPPFEVVVAHCDEDLSWLKALAEETTVYTKGASSLRLLLRYLDGGFLADSQGKRSKQTANRFPPGVGKSTNILDNCRMVHILDNIGSESHTYLYHICKNYRLLAGVTIFVQGDVYKNDSSVPPHVSMGTREMKSRALELKDEELLALGDRRRRFVDWNGIPWEKCPAHAEWYAKHNGDEMIRADRTPGETWADAIGEAHPEAIYWTEGSCFAVRAETVGQWPRQFYKKLLRMFSGANGETAHYMERFWYAIFSERYIEWDPSEREEEDKEVVVCKLPDCKAHGVP